MDLVDLEIVDDQLRKMKQPMVEMKFSKASWVYQQRRVYLKG
jgi:hypothetical protein